VLIAVEAVHLVPSHAFPRENVQIFALNVSIMSMGEIRPKHQSHDSSTAMILKD
jgi:hypothetical protein